MISVVIPTCNRNDLLSKCLDCLAPANQSLDGSCYEVIVTDDSKENIAKELIQQQFPWASWVDGPKKGPAANRNNGAAKASGEWLVFVDDDCLPSAGLLHEYTEAVCNNKDVLVFEGSISPDRPQYSFDEECPANESGGYLWSCNFMIKKDLFFDKLKGFDEQFPYAAMEDVDLAYRLHKMQIAILFLKSASVIHPWRKQTRMYQVTVNRFKSGLYFLRKHPERWDDVTVISFLRNSYNMFFKNGLSKVFKYRFRGFMSMLIYSNTNTVFGIYLLLKK